MPGNFLVSGRGFLSGRLTSCMTARNWIVQIESYLSLTFHCRVFHCLFLNHMSAEVKADVTPVSADQLKRDTHHIWLEIQAEKNRKAEEKRKQDTERVRQKYASCIGEFNQLATQAAIDQAKAGNWTDKARVDWVIRNHPMLSNADNICVSFLGKRICGADGR